MSDGAEERKRTRRPDDVVDATLPLSVSQIYRVAGLVGLLWIALGLVRVGHAKAVPLLLRVFWSALAVFYGPAYVLGLILASAKGRTPSSEDMFNDSLAVALACATLGLLVLLPARIQAIVAALVHARLETASRAAMESELRMAGNLAGVVSLLVVAVGSLFAVVTFIDGRDDDGNLFLFYATHRVSMGIGVGIEYFVSATLGFTFSMSMRICRAAICVSTDGHAHLHAFVRFFAIVIAITSGMATLGIILFLFVLSPELGSLLLINTLIAMLVAIYAIIELSWTIRLDQLMLVRESSPEDAIRKRKWRRDSARMDEEGEEEDGLVRTAAPRESLWFIMSRAVVLALVTFVAICVWFLPSVIVAGPVSLLDANELEKGQSETIGGSPSAIFSAIVFPFFYIAAVPVCVGAATEFEQWPRHLLTFILPFYMVLVAVHISAVSVDRFVIVAISTVVVVLECILFPIWLRRVRPEWTFLRPYAFAVLTALPALMVVSFVIMPIFLDPDNTDRNRIAIRIVLEVGTSALALIQVPGLHNFGEHPLVIRPYVPYLFAVPLSLYGRFMVSGVDTLLGQFISVVLIGLIEIVAAVAVPVGTVAVLKLRNADKSLAWAIDEAELSVSLPVKACVRTIRCALEYVGIVLVPVTVLTHAAVWYDDVDMGSLFLRLFLSALMQLAVEMLVDLIVAFIRSRHYGLRFAPVFALGFGWMAVLLVLLSSVLLAASNLNFVRLARRIVITSGG